MTRWIGIAFITTLTAGYGIQQSPGVFCGSRLEGDRLRGGHPESAPSVAISTVRSLDPVTPMRRLSGSVATRRALPAGESMLESRPGPAPVQADVVREATDAGQARPVPMDLAGTAAPPEVLPDARFAPGRPSGNGAEDGRGAGASVRPEFVPGYVPGEAAGEMPVTTIGQIPIFGLPGSAGVQSLVSIPTVSSTSPGGIPAVDVPPDSLPPMPPGFSPALAAPAGSGPLAAVSPAAVAAPAAANPPASAAPGTLAAAEGPAASVVGLVHLRAIPPTSNQLCTYHWSVQSGPGSDQDWLSADRPDGRYYARRGGQYVFRLDVTDLATQEEDHVTVTVTVAAAAPVALVHMDPTVPLSTLIGGLKLDGGESYDAEGDPLAFEWEQVAGPAVLHLEDATSPVAVASAIGGGAVLGDYLFRVTVSGVHGTDARLVPVSVVPDDPTPVPTAVAATVVCSAAASDLILTQDGTRPAPVLALGPAPASPVAAAPFRWRQTAGPVAPPVDPVRRRLAAMPALPGTYAYQVPTATTGDTGADLWVTLLPAGVLPPQVSAVVKCDASGSFQIDARASRPASSESLIAPTYTFRVVTGMALTRCVTPGVLSGTCLSGDPVVVEATVRWQQFAGRAIVPVNSLGTGVATLAAAEISSGWDSLR